MGRKKQPTVHLHDWRYHEGDRPGVMRCTICGKKIVVRPASTRRSVSR
jgi:hypothetical protein